MSHCILLDPTAPRCTVFLRFHCRLRSVSCSVVRPSSDSISGVVFYSLRRGKFCTFATN